MPTRELWLYVGTYTFGKSDGIYACRFDVQTGEISKPHLAAKLPQASFLCFSPDGQSLYSVVEGDEFEDNPGGAVAAFTVDPESGELTPLGSQRTHGRSPCHLTVDASGENLLVANYGSGSVSVFPILVGGTLGPLSDYVQHHGSSVNPDRQEAPHAHSVIVDQRGHVYSCDLGIDKVMLYRLDPKEAKLAPQVPSFVELEAGQGPRHMALHPGHKFAYVISELGNRIIAFKVDDRSGGLKPIRSVSTLPTNYSGENKAAGICAHPNGRFLYGSNRGHDSLILCAIHPDSGELKVSGHTPSGGKTPRSFTIDPSGRWLLAANQDSHQVQAFQIDPESGSLTKFGEPANVSDPVCVAFCPPDSEARQ